MRIGWVLIFLFVAPALYALEVTVGSSFKITDVLRVDDKLALPAERKRYYNIRILNRETLAFVQKCTEPCVQAGEEIFAQVQEVRPAQTRENMWLVSVSFNQAWLITFLVFKNGEVYKVKTPEHFSFLDDRLEQYTREIILKHVKESL